MLNHLDTILTFSKDKKGRKNRKESPRKLGYRNRMATPLDGGGVAVLSNSVNKVDSASPLKDDLKCSKPESPILIFLFFHKAIRNELEALHRLALAFATGNRSDIQPLSERYHFLSSMYRHHSNAEDEVLIFCSSLCFRSSFFVRLCNLISRGERNGLVTEDFIVCCIFNDKHNACLVFQFLWSSPLG